MRCTSEPHMPAAAIRTRTSPAWGGSSSISSTESGRVSSPLAGGLAGRLDPGARLVRVVGSNLCGSDVHCWEGKLATRTLPLPVVLGHEIVGEVVAIDPADGGDVRGRQI